MFSRSPLLAALGVRWVPSSPGAPLGPVGDRTRPRQWLRISPRWTCLARWTRGSIPGMEVVELCRSCRHERSTHREEDGRCVESIEMMLDDDGGIPVAIRCDCPGWPG